MATKLDNILDELGGKYNDYDDLCHEIRTLLFSIEYNANPINEAVDGKIYNIILKYDVENKTYKLNNTNCTMANLKNFSEFLADLFTEVP
jgi:hypothetical protein